VDRSCGLGWSEVFTPVDGGLECSIRVGATVHTDVGWSRSRGSDIDLKALAQSQVFIQSTIALATSQMQGGQSLIGDALAEQSEADKVLQAAADAQIKQDAAYSAAMGQAFKAIGTIAAIGVGTMVGGPAGGMLGASLAGAAFGSGGTK